MQSATHPPSGHAPDERISRHLSQQCTQNDHRSTITVTTPAFQAQATSMTPVPPIGQSVRQARGASPGPPTTGVKPTLVRMSRTCLSACRSSSRAKRRNSLPRREAKSGGCRSAGPRHIADNSPCTASTVKLNFVPLPGPSFSARILPSQDSKIRTQSAGWNTTPPIFHSKNALVQISAHPPCTRVKEVVNPKPPPTSPVSHLD